MGGPSQVEGSFQLPAAQQRLAVGDQGMSGCSVGEGEVSRDGASFRSTAPMGRGGRATRRDRMVPLGGRRGTGVAPRRGDPPRRLRLIITKGDVLMPRPTFG